VESEVRPAVQTDELSTGERELDGEHVALLATRKVGGCTVDGIDPRIGQERDVEARCLLRLPVEPEAGGDLVFGPRPSFTPSAGQRARTSRPAGRSPG